ncbi:MAG: hypothetical protein HY913_23950 [Desulfomonile tiedjei]|nr:hypothetical protein [Desulfomonile tiedjei]
MDKRSSKKKKPRDLNLLAARIVEEATIEDALLEIEPQKEEKNPNAVALGRLGGLKGGLVRAQRLTAEQRSKIAKKAAYARWEKKKKSNP